MIKKAAALMIAALAMGCVQSTMDVEEEQSGTGQFLERTMSIYGIHGTSQPVRTLAVRRTRIAANDLKIER